MNKSTLCVVFVCALYACAEQLPNQTNSSDAEKNIRSSTAPVIVFNDELASTQINNGIRVSEDITIVLNDANTELDGTAVRSNQTLRARAASGVGLKATGTSRIIERAYFDLGVQISYTRYEYDAAGVRTRRAHFNGVGLDGQWSTADDVVKNYTLFDVQRNGITAHAVFFNGPGVDNVWFNDDDSIRYYQTDVTDAAGAVIAKARVNNPGPDLSWFTADDGIQIISTNTTLADGSEEWMLYRTPGADGDWATLADNGIGHYSLVTVDAATGNNTRHAFYINPGLDGVTYTADDMVGFYHDFTYDANNLLVEIIAYAGGAGPDGTWFTADDLIKTCSTRDYNPDNTVNLVKSFDAGLDLACFTADDTITYYHDHTYDATGHMLGSNTYMGPGVDTQWFTADDEVVKTSTYVAN